MALLEAANEGDLVGLIKLVQKGVKITTTDKWDWTALHMAAYHGHENILIFLINEGLDVDARTFDNETPLDLALKKGHVRIARIIEEVVKHRAD
jgi:ankyrin repeat protein